jgi:uncharacterized OB-fold protein
MSTKPQITLNTTSAPFWAGVARHELLLQYDPVADRYQFYPRPIGLYSTTALEWRAARGTGTLVAITKTHFAAPGFADEPPYLEGVVELDEGPRVFAPVVGTDLAAFSPGQRMRVAWPAANAGGHPFQFESFPHSPSDKDRS